ncbi:MAG: pre-peptidase C-terminal domain-containing protein [Candidatus Schekmanbacteria bacterium]|nr:pre-peptidase C-terminal domain-containing protein [Candidatus Schekmanbacteria bacterium]
MFKNHFSFHTFVLGILASLLLLIIPAITHAAEITYGQRIEGTLDEQDTVLNGGLIYDEYAFTGTAGQKIILNLSSPDFDAILWLLDSQRKAITVQNYWGEGTDTTLSNYTLPVTGAYYVWATSFSPGETGRYTLTFTDYPVIKTPPVALSVGNPVSGVLSAGDNQLSDGRYFQVYSFNASPDKVFHVELKSPDFDAYLWLLDSSGKVITVDNNPLPGESGTDAHLVFPSQTNENCTLWVSSYNPGETGAYSLSLYTSPAIGRPNLLFSGQTIDNSLAWGGPQPNTGQFTDVYAFNGMANQGVTISLSSSDVDTYLRLLDKNGNFICNRDDIGKDNKNSYIGNFALPASGAYYVWATTPYPGDRGGYSLSFTQSAASAGTFSGRVTNACSGAGIADAAVTTDPNGYYTLTDAEGNYTISNVAAGTYTVNVAADKYASGSQPGIAVSIGGEIVADLPSPPPIARGLTLWRI